MQNRTEALQCPYQGLPVALTPAPMYTPPTPPRGIQGKTSASIDLKAEVFCSFQQMNVVLPPGPITEIVVKGVYGGVDITGAFGSHQLCMSSDGLGLWSAVSWEGLSWGILHYSLLLS